MFIEDEKDDPNEYYFNYYDHIKADVSEFNLRKLDAQFLTILENIIVGLAFALIFFLLLATVLSSNYVYVFFKTCVHRPKQNIIILWDIINIRNPVYRLVCDALNEESYENISQHKYSYSLKKFEREKRKVSADNRKSYQMHKTLFKLQDSFSAFTGAKVVDYKQLKDVEKLKMVEKNEGKAFEVITTE